MSDEPIHFVEVNRGTPPCGAAPAMVTRDAAAVTCPVCQLVLGAPAGAIRIAVVEVAFYPFRFTCASCERLTTRATTDESLAQHWTRLIRMGFSLLCTECEPKVPAGT